MVDRRPPARIQLRTSSSLCTLAPGSSSSRRCGMRQHERNEVTVTAPAIAGPAMTLTTEPYVEQVTIWPREGRHILAQFDDETVIVYQAYAPAIGRYAAQHGHFGGDFSYSTDELGEAELPLDDVPLRVGHEGQTRRSRSPCGCGGRSSTRCCRGRPVVVGPRPVPDGGGVVAGRRPVVGAAAVGPGPPPVGSEAGAAGHPAGAAGRGAGSVRAARSWSRSSTSRSSSRSSARCWRRAACPRSSRRGSGCTGRLTRRRWRRCDWPIDRPFRRLHGGRRPTARN